MPPRRCAAHQPPGARAPGMTSQQPKVFQGHRKATWRAACLCDDEPAHPCSWRWKPPEGPSARQVPGPAARRAEPTRLAAACGDRCPGRRPQLGAGPEAPWSGWGSAKNAPGLLAHGGLLRAAGPARSDNNQVSQEESAGGGRQGRSEALLCLWPQDFLTTSATGKDLGFSCPMTLHITHEQDCSDRAARSGQQRHPARRHPALHPHPHCPAQEQQSSAHTGRAGGGPQLCLLGRTSWAPHTACPALDSLQTPGRGGRSP